VDVGTVVKTIINEAKVVAGSGPMLAQRLEEIGVGPDGRYSTSAVSNWINGRTMPPADVLLAAAQIAGLSLDEHLGMAVEQISDGEWASVAADMQEQIDALRAQVIELYGRLGQPMPGVAPVEEPSSERKVV
jgi:transcriptional regulator with XRE-family HTH domain